MLFPRTPHVSKRQNLKKRENHGKEFKLTWKSRVTFPTNHLLAIVLASERFERRLDNPAAESEDKMKCRFLTSTSRISISHPTNKIPTPSPQNEASNNPSKSPLHYSPNTQSPTSRKQTTSYLLNVIIRQRPSILQLFPRKYQTLLVWWDPLFILDLGFYIVDCV